MVFDFADTICGRNAKAFLVHWRGTLVCDNFGGYKALFKQGATEADLLHQWLRVQRQRVPEGCATAKAIDYSLRRWNALTRYLDDGSIPIDNNWVENQIRPIALGRKNSLFAGSLRSGQRAAAVTSLIHSTRLKGYDVYAYMKEVLERLPSLPTSRIRELLPHCLEPVSSA